MGKLFLGGCLILVWSVTKKNQVLKNKQIIWSRKTKSNQFAKLSLNLNFGIHQKNHSFFKFLILDFGGFWQNLGRI